MIVICCDLQECWNQVWNKKLEIVCYTVKLLICPTSLHIPNISVSATVHSKLNKQTVKSIFATVFYRLLAILGQSALDRFSRLRHSAVTSVLTDSSQHSPSSASTFLHYIVIVPYTFWFSQVGGCSLIDYIVSLDSLAYIPTNVIDIKVWPPQQDLKQ